MIVVGRGKGEPMFPRKACSPGILIETCPDSLAPWLARPWQGAGSLGKQQPVRTLNIMGVDPPGQPHPTPGLWGIPGVDRGREKDCQAAML